MRTLPLVLTCLATLPSVACQRQVPAAAPPAPAPVAAATAPARSSCEPVKLALLIDKSASAPKARTADIGVADLEPLIQLVAECGGEISLGSIHDEDAPPFSRLRIAPPPSGPQVPTWSHNKLQRRRQEIAFKPARQKHDEVLDAWRSDTQERVDAFVGQAEQVLAGPADARHSPIWDAVRRADALLAETDPDWPACPRWIVAVTDGIDDTGARAVALESGARLLVVNGLASAHSLAVLKPSLFESLSSALRVVVGKSVASE